MENTEIVVNLWYVMDADTNLVYRLAGRVYALAGTDAEKTSLLKTLSRSDYLVAETFPVPRRFHVSNGKGQMDGFCFPQTLRDNLTNVYEEVFAALEKDIPARIRFIGEEAETIPLTIPQNPLCITTALVEDTNGTLTPHVR